MSLTKVTTTMIAYSQGISVEDYGGKTIANGGAAFDNHDAILAAVTANPGKRILFSAGIYRSSPISFAGLQNVHLEGVSTGPVFVAANSTQIQFLGTSGIGFQFADNVNPYLTGPTFGTDAYWVSTFPTVRYMTLDATNIDVGMNGNYGPTFDTVEVKFAKQNGIVLEDYTYPAYLRNVQGNNGLGNGIFVRGPRTTNWTMDECSFGSNAGWGIVVEGAAVASINKTPSQGNAKGALKIYWDNSSGFTPYLQDIELNSFYTEANGTAVTYPYDIVVDSSDVSGDVTLRPRNISLINSSINPGAGGKKLNFNSVLGYTISNTVLEGAPTDYTFGVRALAGRYIGGIAQLASSSTPLANYPLSTRIDTYDTNKAACIVTGMWLATRGRTQVFTFYVNDATANTVVLMELTGVLPTGAGKGYTMPYAGSLLGIQVQRAVRNGNESGTLSFKPIRSLSYEGVDSVPSHDLSGPAITPLTSTATTSAGTLYGSADYSVDIYKFAQFDRIAVQMTTPVGYVNGPPTNPIIINLFVEF